MSGEFSVVYEGVGASAGVEGIQRNRVNSEGERKRGRYRRKANERVKKRG